MEPITTYGKMSRGQLLNELGDVTSSLAGRIKELGALQADINNDWYPIYAREPSNSVAAKEKAANYACLAMLNDKEFLLAEIHWLTSAKECLMVMVKHAT